MIEKQSETFYKIHKLAIIYIALNYMKQNKNKLIVSILITGLFVCSVLGCVFALQNSTMMHGEHSSSIAQCCNMDQVFGGTIHNMPSILGNNVFQILLLLGVGLYIFLKDNYTEHSFTKAYYYKIRDKHGGFKLFCYFILLFSKGILHPKIY